MPRTPFRYVLNTLLYILITGCRWCDVPQGKQWASKSSAHRWLKRWHALERFTSKPWRASPTQSVVGRTEFVVGATTLLDGTFEHLQSRILAIADSQGLINWNYGTIDIRRFDSFAGGLP